ncbi:hypothetical protein [Pseudomonas sp. efr-133-TYG-5]|jgi:hypothetical protein|uniref:DUF6896 domain-containing protein n=1 Tax=Pseudomonas sp. efr-133-TYG-5 TaxID=3040310 RepID=UPI002554B784|nr:hypothetical protein [Pseudomonas sp. efr-133-TYG-5]
MSNHNITLEDLINDFLSKVEIGTKLLEEKFGSRNILNLWKTQKIKRCGEITKGIQYELHGAGCFIHFPSETINFDYGPNNRVDGFDIWRLYVFACDRPLSYPRYCRKENVEEEFLKYLSENRIEKMPASDDLYVLTRNLKK